MSIKRFDLGETKYVEVRISSRDRISFEISSAEYEVLKQDGTVEQAKTDATIDGYIIGGIITTPSKKGEYIVKFYYVIGTEKYVHKVRVDVE